MKDLVVDLFRNVPSGVGSHRKDLRLEVRELREVLEKGASWATSRGFGSAADLDSLEAGGGPRLHDRFGKDLSQYEQELVLCYRRLPVKYQRRLLQQLDEYLILARQSARRTSRS